MAMNNVYYRFVHLASNPIYGTLPAKLRMNVIGAPGIDKADFELFSLAVSAQNGCGMCIDSHEERADPARRQGRDHPGRRPHRRGDEGGGDGARDALGAARHRHRRRAMCRAFSASRRNEPRKELRASVASSSRPRPRPAAAAR